MYKFQQNKLWRDKAHTRAHNSDAIFHFKHLSDTEYDAELRAKLLEETNEVHVANNAAALIEELADVYEVIDALCAFHGITKEQVIAAQTKKRDERGGFYNRTYITIAEFPAGSYGEDYCRAQPDKYPEVK